MPVAAAGLSDVGARDPQPLVLGGSVEHAPKQLAVPNLELVLLAERRASGGNAVGERVANPLKLPKSGETRAAGRRRNPSIDRHSREGLGG